MRGSVQNSSVHPHPAGPASSSTCSSSSWARLSRHRAPPGPLEASAGRPPAASARRQRLADIRAPRKRAPPPRSVAPSSIHSAASSRSCSRRAQSSAVSPPPWGYLMVVHSARRADCQRAAEHPPLMIVKVGSIRSESFDAAPFCDLHGDLRPPEFELFGSPHIYLGRRHQYSLRGAGFLTDIHGTARRRGAALSPPPTEGSGAYLSHHLVVTLDSEAAIFLLHRYSGIWDDVSPQWLEHRSSLNEWSRATVNPRWSSCG